MGHFYLHFLTIFLTYGLFTTNFVHEYKKKICTYTFDPIYKYLQRGNPNITYYKLKLNETKICTDFPRTPSKIHSNNTLRYNGREGKKLKNPTIN